MALFDQLVLLARGRCVYSGLFDKAQGYFDDQGYSCPQGFNIADYLVDLTVHAEQRRSIPHDDIALGRDEAFSSSQSSRVNSGSESGKGHSRRKPPSIRERQAKQLFTRKKSSGSTTGAIIEDGLMLSDDMDLASQSVRELNVRPQNLEETEGLLPPPARRDVDRNDLDILVDSYFTSLIAIEMRQQMGRAAAERLNGAPNGNSEIGLRGGLDGKGFRRVGWPGQFAILSARTWKNLYRNPMLMLAHYAIAIVLAVLCGYLFFGIKDDISGFQNRMGLFFFVLALFGFSTLTSLNVFASERTLFLRERANSYYAPITYFASKVIFDIVPLRIIPPIIMGTILYPMVGLVTTWPEFFKFLLVLVLFNLAASAICLFIGIVFKDTSLASLVGSLVMLFSLLMAGLLLNHNSIPKEAQWLQNLSIFHYGFEALIVNEVRYLTLVEHKYLLQFA